MMDLDQWEQYSGKVLVLPEDADLTPYIRMWWGHQEVTITEEHIEALRAGKKLIFHDSEYTCELQYKEKDEPALPD